MSTFDRLCISALVVHLAAATAGACAAIAIAGMAVLWILLGDTESKDTP